MRKLFALLLLSSPVSAQVVQQPDPIFLQKVINAVQAQRDTANNNAAIEAARAAMLADEVDKLKAELDALKEKTK